jgi:hypothetical protein
MSAQAAHETEVKREQSVVNAWIMTPITFYGKVVDEKGNSVDAAKVVMSAADRPFASGSKYERITDAAGIFSITGIHGAALQVEVSKQGYYSLPQSWGKFGYANRVGTEMTPPKNPNEPAIFILRKMGQTEPVISQNLHMEISKDGRPTQVDLKSGKRSTGGSGDIQIELWANTAGRPPNSNQPFDWRCRISVPGGGMVPRSGEFNFEAPLEGYQSEDTIDMSSSAKGWQDKASREYFLKLKSGEYARVNISVAVGGLNYQFFNMTSYLNPAPGSRNLEFDPAKAVKSPTKGANRGHE